MELRLNKSDRAKLYLATLTALDDYDEQETVDAFADVISFANDGYAALAEVFSLSDAVAILVAAEHGIDGKYLQISLKELAGCVGDKKVATTALRLNGFKAYKNSDGWTNSPNGGRGIVVSIGPEFFMDYLQNWTKIA